MDKDALGGPRFQPPRGTLSKQGGYGPQGSENGMRVWGFGMGVGGMEGGEGVRGHALREWKGGPQPKTLDPIIHAPVGETTPYHPMGEASTYCLPQKRGWGHLPIPPLGAGVEIGKSRFLGAEECAYPWERVGASNLTNMRTVPGSNDKK